MDEIFKTLLLRTDKHGYTYANGDDVDLWSSRLSLSVPTFLNEISRALALAYQAGDSSYEFCDSLINDLWAIFMDRVGKPNEIKCPDLFIEVYDAFDAGEYHRSPDKSDNPVADYTDPQIAKIVAELS